MLYLLCLSCRQAWVAPVAASCCGAKPLTCRPGTLNARVWLHSRLTTARAAAIAASLSRDSRAHLATIRRGVERVGNTWCD